MRIFAVLLLVFLLSAQMSQAQLSVQTDQADVTIGPNGIRVNSKDTGSQANILIGPSGVNVDSSKGSTRSSVHVGSGITVKRGGHSLTGSVRSTSKRTSATIVKAGTAGKMSRSSQTSASTPNASDQISLIETEVYGEQYAGKPLLARVERLEVDHFGQKSTGSLKARINVLAKELGVSLTGVASSSSGSHTTTVSVQSSASSTPATAVTIKQSGSNAQSVAAGPTIGDMVINDDGQIIRGHCNGNSIVLNGDNCQLVLSGTLDSLIVNGNHSRITVDRIVSLVTNGNANSVIWSRPANAPSIVNNGSGNVLQAK